MKTSSIVACCCVLLAFSAHSQIELNGPVSFEISGDMVTLRVAEIRNTSGTARKGFLNIQLIATPTREVSPNQFFRLAEASIGTGGLGFGVINAGEAFTGIMRTAPFVEPPAGTYFLHLTVTIFDARLPQFGADDFLDIRTFDEQQTFGGDTPITDHGDTPETATLIAPDGVIDGALQQGGDVDYFRFDIPATGTLVVTTTGTTDTFGRLSTADGSEELFDDDSGSGLNFLIRTNIAAGPFLLEVTGFDASTTGSYRLELDYDPGAAIVDDHGNTLEDATLTPVGSLTAGFIDFSGDQDAFQIDVSAGGTLSITTSGDADTFGVLTDATGTTVASNDDGGNGLNFLINTTVDAGTYFVFVSGFGTTTGPYELEVGFSANALEDDHGNTPDAASMLDSSGTVDGLIGAAGDADLFRIDIADGGLLTVAASGSTDTFGRLLDNNGAVIAQDDDSGEGFNFLLQSVVSAGVYFVEVTGFAGVTVGPYTVTSTLEVGGGLSNIRVAPNLTVDPSFGCPGFYIGRLTSVDSPGRWSMEVQLDPNQRPLLQGGLNLGGGFGGRSAPGFAAFNIANATGESQRVTVDVTTEKPTDLQYNLEVIRRQSGQQTVIASTTTTSAQTTISEVLEPGFYSVRIFAASENSQGASFNMSLATRFVDRNGGAFQGGVNLGGIFDLTGEFGSPDGFGALCIDREQVVSFESFGRDAFGAAGTQNVQLTVLDRARNVVVQSP